MGKSLELNEYEKQYVQHNMYKITFNKYDDFFSPDEKELEKVRLWVLMYYLMNLGISVTGKMTLFPKELFWNCQTLQSIYIPRKIQFIGVSAFGFCHFLREINFSDADELCKIGMSAFYECTSLESVTLPSSLQEIGEKAFAYCTMLENVVLPETIRDIGWDAFSYTKIKQLVYKGSSEQWKNNVFCHHGWISDSPISSVKCLKDGVVVQV